MQILFHALHIFVRIISNMQILFHALHIFVRIISEAWLQLLRYVCAFTSNTFLDEAQMLLTYSKTTSIATFCVKHAIFFDILR